MFDRFWELLGLSSSPRTRSQAEKIAAFDLTQQPFARALLSRAAVEIDECDEWLKSTFGRERKREDPTDLNRELRNASCIVVLSIIYDMTAQTASREMFFPNGSSPHGTNLILAFTFIILMGITVPLHDEGNDLDFKEACMGATLTLFPMHSAEEQSTLYERAAEIFRQIMLADATNVREWRDNVTRITLYYIEQFTTDNQKLRGQNLKPVFRSLFQSLLAAAE